MSVGYPDYARLSQGGATELYSTNNSSPTYDTNLFQGYVGTWPYINLQTRMNSESDIARFAIAYYDGPEFDNIIAYRYVVRLGTQEATTQYANLSPWMAFSYTTISGDPIPVQALSLYGATAPADQFQLASMENPITSYSGAIAASTTATSVPSVIQPGDAIFNFFTTMTEWNVRFLYYEFTSAEYVEIANVNYETYAASGFIKHIPMFDAPMQIAVENATATAASMTYNWCST